ncbi:hypothetical protein A6U91_21155 [Agrobacterium tumefaciens]|uniref:Uncharacterized protein n=1 Tax=Agrobacterium tumefaciens TaxID=358 RepID=A0AB36EBX5_AGRTU|nr:hypothetical protein A6U91_21155 [Agrobacterium tumefaciens]
MRAGPPIRGLPGKTARLCGQEAGRRDGKKLAELRKSVLDERHLTVFSEMRRQRQVLLEIRVIIEQAPEAIDWPVIRT